MPTCLKSSWVLFTLAVVFCGCSEQKKPVAVAPAAAIPAAVTSESKGDVAEPVQPELVMLTPTGPVITEEEELSPGAAPSHAVTPTEPSGNKSDTPANNATVETAALPSALPFKEASYLPKDTVGLLVVHPRRFQQTHLGKVLAEVVDDQYVDGPLEFLQKLHIKYADIDRVTVVMEQTLVNTFARLNGLPVPGGTTAAGAPRKIELKNALKQIGLAFHNYYDVRRRFPRANGDGSGELTGLSWRVHLLPYLEEQELYQQFHLDEPWDSEHNKALIPRMPPIFKSPGVTEEGKTAFHVFTGEGTMFNGDQGIEMENVTDGLSNTILSFLGAPDTAEFWTRPGGTEVDLESPRKSFGDLEGQPVMVLFADGSVRELSADVDEKTLAALIQTADGKSVPTNLDGGYGSSVTAYDGPLVIVSLHREVDATEVVSVVLNQPVQDQHEGKAFFKNSSKAVWNPSSTVVVFGAPDSVKKAIETSNSGDPADCPLVKELNLEVEFTGSFDLESQSEIVSAFAQSQPMFGMVSNIKTATARFSAAGKVGEPICEFAVNAFNEDLATALAAVATAGLGQAKATIAQFPEQPNANASEKEIQNFVRGLISDASVSQNGSHVALKVPTPQGFNHIVDLLKPAMISARTAALETRQRNSLRMIGLAFHNFHDVYAAFPGAGRIRAEGPVGLSWRVHLLPFLDQAELYDQFHRDEPWDSEHNKALIEKMPAIFKSAGVDDEFKTSIHVFAGPGSIFENDGVTGIAQITDGTSNTILAVLAGPETAEIWTKPGGLDFDPDDPIKALGNLPHQTFITLFADGSVRNIQKEIDSRSLRRLIQMKDGEVPSF